MNLFRTAAAAFAVTAGLLAAQSASAYERWVDLHNVGGSTIVAVQISDIGRDTWGGNVLDATIPAGYVGEVEPDTTRGYCRFDMRLSYADGSVAEIYDVNLCEAVDLVTDGDTYFVDTI